MIKNTLSWENGLTAVLILAAGLFGYAEGRQQGWDDCYDQVLALVKEVDSQRIPNSPLTPKRPIRPVYKSTTDLLASL